MSFYLTLTTGRGLTDIIKANQGTVVITEGNRPQPIEVPEGWMSDCFGPFEDQDQARAYAEKNMGIRPHTQFEPVQDFARDLPYSLPEHYTELLMHHDKMVVQPGRYQPLDDLLEEMGIDAHTTDELLATMEEAAVAEFLEQRNARPFGKTTKGMLEHCRDGKCRELMEGNRKIARPGPADDGDMYFELFVMQSGAMVLQALRFGVTFCHVFQIDDIDVLEQTIRILQHDQEVDLQDWGSQEFAYSWETHDYAYISLAGALPGSTYGAKGTYSYYSGAAIDRLLEEASA